MLSVPDGYTLELAASNPVSQYPVFGCFDNIGRLYVGEASGVREWKESQPEDKKELWHRLVRLKDTDGDNVFDKREVLDYFDRPVQGVQCLGDNTLFVSSPPCIWKLVDANFDGQFEVREKWYEQVSPMTNCLNDLHGPVLGPDGWLYFTKGAASEIEFGTRSTPIRSSARHLLRRHPAGGLTESVMNGGMDNPVEVCFTRGGERILTATNFQMMGQPRRDGVIHALIGALVPKDISDGFGFPWSTPEYYDHPIFQGGATSVAGITRCEGAHWPNRFFVAQFSGRCVTQLQLTEMTGTYAAESQDVVTSEDSVFHPTDVIEDADGSLLILDTGGWYLHCCPSSTFFRPEATGFIYRLKRSSAEKIDDSRGLQLDWTNADPTELAWRLNDQRPVVRQRSQQQLVEIGDQVISVLAKHDSAIERKTTASGREAGVWVAAQILGNDIASNRDPTSVVLDYLQSSLEDPDSAVRLASINALSLYRQHGASEALIRRLEVDESSLCRRAAAEALGRLRCETGVTAILSSLTRDDGGYALDHSLGLSLIEIADTPRMLESLNHPHPKVRRAALMTLEQTGSHVLSPSHVMPQLESPDPIVRQAAWWVVARHTLDWGVELTDTLRNRWTVGGMDESTRQDLVEKLSAVASAPEIQDFLATELLNPSVPEATRILILNVMATRRGAGVARWWDAVIDVINTSQNSRQLIEMAASTLAAMPTIIIKGPRELPEREQHVIRVKRIRMSAGNEHLTNQARLDLLQAASGSLGQPSDAQFEFLRAAMRADQPIALRASAAEGLSRCELTSAQLEKLAGCLDTVATAELNRLLDCFKSCNEDSIGKIIMASLDKSQAALSISPIRIENLLAAFGPIVRQQAQPFLDRIASSDREQLLRAEHILSLVSQGDPQRGLSVFQSKKYSCQECHVAVLVGGNIGPSLRGLGKRRNERDILESILFPNASLVQSYETWKALLSDGRIISGVLLADSPNAIRLGTAKSVETIPRSEIEELVVSNISIMPTGLDRTMADEEIADLVAYLKSL